MQGDAGTLYTYGALANIDIEQGGDTWFYKLDQITDNWLFATGVLSPEGITTIDGIIPA
jgi:hypothetical protein